MKSVVSWMTLDFDVHMQFINLWRKKYAVIGIDADLKVVLLKSLLGFKLSSVIAINLLFIKL